MAFRFYEADFFALCAGQGKAKEFFDRYIRPSREQQGPISPAMGRVIPVTGVLNGMDEVQI